jgi:hypothetical protein
MQVRRPLVTFQQDPSTRCGLTASSSSSGASPAPSRHAHLDPTCTRRPSVGTTLSSLAAAQQRQREQARLPAIGTEPVFSGHSRLFLPRLAVDAGAWYNTSKVPVYTDKELTAVHLSAARITRLSTALCTGFNHSVASARVLLPCLCVRPSRPALDLSSSHSPAHSQASLELNPITATPLPFQHIPLPNYPDGYPLLVSSLLTEARSAQVQSCPCVGMKI